MFRHLLIQLVLLIGIVGLAAADPPPDPEYCMQLDYHYCTWTEECPGGDPMEWCYDWSGEQCWAQPYCFEEYCGEVNEFAMVICQYFGW